MGFNTFKKMGVGSLSSCLKKYQSKYRSSQWDIYEDILCEVSEDYNGIHISACFKTNDPYSGGIDINGQVWFYKSEYVLGLSESLLVLTKQICKAKAASPDFNYFRVMSLSENDAVAYTHNLKSLDSKEMESWLDKAWKCKQKGCYIYEQFVGGTWVESNRLPWE